MARIPQRSSIRRTRGLNSRKCHIFLSSDEIVNTDNVRNFCLTHRLDFTEVLRMMQGDITSIGEWRYAGYCKL